MRYVVLLTGAMAVCCAAVLAAEDLVKEKDIRNASETTLNRHFITFCARPGTPGHAFVSFGKEDEEKQQSTQVAYGLYPSEGEKEKLGFGTVPGEIVDEVTKGSLSKTTHRLICKVTQAQYEQADKIRKEWSEKKEYNPVNQNCITFTRSVAKELGLKVPESSDFNFPVDFLKELIEIN